MSEKNNGAEVGWKACWDEYVKPLTETLNLDARNMYTDTLAIKIEFIKEFNKLKEQNKIMREALEQLANMSDYEYEDHGSLVAESTLEKIND